VVALLVVAGVDALRSSGSETSAPTASTTTAIPTSSLPPCAEQDLRISIEVRQGVATVVAQNIRATRCYRLFPFWRLTIEDRAGDLVEEWPDVGQPLVDGIFPGGVERTFWLPQDQVLCDSPGPYVALATVGPYSARLGNLSRSEVACGASSGGTHASRVRAKYIAQADAICKAATARFGAADFKLSGTPVEQEAAWNEAAARASERALTKLRALSPPKADRDPINEVISLMQLQTNVLRQAAAEGSAGHARAARLLGLKRIDLTHQKDGFAHRLGLLWGVSPDPLSGCPVSLPA
jgi:hypothetical protein